jgi:hypothetical protein
MYPNILVDQIAPFGTTSTCYFGSRVFGLWWVRRFPSRERTRDLGRDRLFALLGTMSKRYRTLNEPATSDL